MRLAGFALPIVGILGLLFGVMWGTAVFHNFERIPSDFSRTDEFEGTYTVMDPFVQQIQQNAAVQQLASSPASLTLLADPAVTEFLAGPGLASLLSEPALLQGIVANLAMLQQAMDPSVQQLLASPQVQSVLANPAAAAQSTDPAVQQILANPTIQSLLANPTALQLLLNPKAQGVLGNPVVPRLLANTTIQQLLADPASLQVVLDPRTMRLMADPTAIPTIQVPVLVHRERVATGTDSDKMSINEQVTTTVAGTGNELTGFPKTNLNLVVDRSDKVYLEGTDGGRTGGLAFPFGVKKDVAYPTWVSAARQPLDAIYTATDKLDGLEVYVLKIDVRGKPVPAQASDPGPLVVDSNVTIWVEPRSGRVVDIEDHATTVSLVNTTGGKSPVFISDIEYTQATVDTQVAEGKQDRNDLVLYGTTLPVGIVAVSVLLVVIGVIALQRYSRKAGLL